jgi:hypothetical protein
MGTVTEGGHLLKLRKANGLVCKRCHHETKKASRILCHSETLAELRFRHLGRHLVTKGDYRDIPLCKTLCFTVNTVLLEEKNNGDAQRSILVAVQGPV